MGKDGQADTAYTPMIKAGVEAAMITRAAVSALYIITGVSLRRHAE
jgi:hypothetical protein